jgi:choline dehydrogenase-like flavoprotein
MRGGIVQARDVALPVEDAADVVIVGSGAGGATVARVLSEAGLDVAIVEEGPHVPAEALSQDLYGAFTSLWRDLGMQVARGRMLMPVLQGSCVGGTTAINGAIVHRMPEAIHAHWRREHGLADFFAYAELSRIWDRLDDELAVGTAPDAVLGNNSALMERGAQRAGVPGNRIRRNVRGCQGAARCNQGCPTARRQSMNNSYVPRAVAAGARVYADCHVRRVAMQGGRAARVEGAFHDRLARRAGPPLRVHARKAIVVAAGAVHTPLLLRASRLGGRSGLLGRRLQAHPGTGVGGLFDEPVSMWFGATQGYETMHWWHERMKLESVGMPLELAAVRMPGFGAELIRNIADFGRLAIWGVQIRARAHGRVAPGLLGGASIAFDLTDEDARTLKLGVRRLCELMFAAGAREVFPGVHGMAERIRSADELSALDALPDDPRLFHGIASHLFGTALMGPDPAASVVGPRGELHGAPGVYVADASIFPTNLGVNPQHSICALAWRIAEGIAGARAAPLAADASHVERHAHLMTARALFDREPVGGDRLHVLRQAMARGIDALAHELP